MKNWIPFPLLLLFLAATSPATAQVLWSENFDGATNPSLPAGWLQYNGDGLIPQSNSQYNFGNNAWVSYHTPGSTDNVMASTSWYTVPGTANDWLITPALAPLANTYLSFQTRAMMGYPYADGFEVKVSTTGTNVANFGTTLLTINAEDTGWTAHAINLSAYSGQTIYIAIVNNSTDDDVLELNNIQLAVFPATDLSLVDVTPHANDLTAFGPSGTQITIGGIVKNTGMNTITSFDFYYYDGMNYQMQTISGLNLQTFQSDTFSASLIPATINGTNTTPIQAFVVAVGDGVPGNDTANTAISGTAFTPVHHVTVEGLDGLWTGWTPRGYVYYDSLHYAHPDAILIDVHESDILMDTIYGNALQSIQTAFPTITVDRTQFGDPSDIFTAYNTHLNDFGFADLTVNNSLAGNALTTTVDCHFACNLNGNYRLAYVVTEDHVHGTTAAYNQNNYYSYQSQNLPLYGNGFDWQAAPNPVPAAQMQYNYVARYIDHSFTGTPGTISTPIAAGDIQSYTFHYNIPAGCNPSNMKTAVLLIDQATGKIMNASGAFVTPCTPTSSSITQTVCGGYTFLGQYLTSSGTYTDTTLNAGGCDSIITLHLTVNPNPTAGFTLVPDTLVLHHWFALNQCTGNPPLTYTWTWGDASAPSTGPNPSHTYSAAGYYNICVSVSDAMGCSDTYCDSSTYITRTDGSNMVISIDVVNALPNGVSTIQRPAIQVFPNPAGNLLHCTYSNMSLAQSAVVDALGQEHPVSYTTSNGQLTFNISDLAPGIYYLRLTGSDKVNYYQKFSKQ